ncbi:hypothetical protein [Amylibacter sp. IMCC11727]|uniref:hypothetical protein n=1 Tax=Amylibacter sp. IMCC11727 TaxID=3039851 RepID=UPI00244DADE3|nr:hypothetical protein [Amylibacter sp. IMCC11727]WGI21655.1 hypothetical protein QBD29_16320 [Amylibacter sp. IMCC11727]
MSDQNQSLGPAKPNNSGAETRIALALTLFWLLACCLYIFGVPNALVEATASLLTLMITFMAMFFPVIVIWTVAYVSNSVRIMQAETNVLRASMDQIKTVLAEKPAMDDGSLKEQLAEITALTQQTDSRLNALAEQQTAPTESGPIRTDAAALAEKTPEPEDLSQTKLPLQTPTGPERMPITVAEFIKALNFPENAEDKEGFRVLRRAFEERELGKLLQASQDVLTLLSQDGIYMDDLNPDKPLPTVWRRFAAGQRGLTVSALGGIRDRSALTLAKTRLKNDPVFRDATHHFLRKFDQILIEFEPTAEDSELLEMSQTRTARAFMLLGRVAGSFD